MEYRDLVPGTAFAGYRIERVLGQGGMSVVYLAEDLRLGRKVALKVLGTQLAADPRFRDRFVRESRLAASLDHPNVVPVYEAGERDRVLFIAMRYVDGTDLRELIQREGRLEPARAVSIVRQVAAALDAAHAKGLVHRDVKPPNILISPEGGEDGAEHVYLSDFGVTKQTRSVRGLTQTGYFVGTPGYAAPEQIEGRAPDPRADQYSLACVLFECLTGHPPFRGGNDVTIMYAHLNEPPPALSAERRDLSPLIDGVIRRALAKSSADRYPTCSEFALAAQGAIQSGPDPASVVRLPENDEPIGVEAPADVRVFDSTTTSARGASGGQASAQGTAASGPVPGDTVSTELGERRRVTILFADFVGFSTLAEHIDPEDLRTIVAREFAGIRAVIEARGGQIEKFIGDAVMAIFGAPVANEDDPLRAVDAAMEMIELVRSHSQESASPLRLRIGVNSGLVVAGMVGDGTQAGVMGDAVNVAARLQQRADPDEIIVSASVWRRVRDHYETDPLGRLDIKGRQQQVEAYRVLRPGRPGIRRQAPFVGRSEEIALLELLWSSASRGNTHVVTLIGEPGVGKSRLLSEFTERQDALDIRTVCEAKRPFGLFVDLVEKILGGLPSDAEDLRRRTDGFDVDEHTVVALATLLGLGRESATIPILEQERRRAYVGIWKMLLAAPQGRPALVVIDDVHSSDESSLELLVFLLERLAGIPLMVVLTCRPGFHLLDRIATRASHTAVHVELLSERESVELARGFLGVEELPEDLEVIIATRAEGNAFFIEELLQALLELGTLIVVGNRARMTRIDLDIPETVQATIQARIDRLLPLERSLIEHASVVGRSFSTALMEAILQPNLSATLEELERAQLIVARGPDEWAFKHALIQEVAYETLLHQQRREMHQRVAEALERTMPEDPLMLESLAEHYARAEAVEKARRYALAAGDSASQRLGVVEASARYRTALKLWGTGDEEGRLRLLMKLGYAELLSADAAAARTVLIEAEAGWRALGDVRQAGATLTLLGRAYFFMGEMDRADESLHRSVELLEPMGASENLVRAWVMTSIMNFVKGRAEEGAELARRGLEMARTLGMSSAQSHLLISLGVFETLLADPSGLDHIRTALRMAEESDDVEAVGRAYLNLAKTLGELSRVRESLEVCEQGRKVLHRMGAVSLEWPIAGIQAQMLVEDGQESEAEDLARDMLGPQRRQLVATAVVYAGLALGEVLVREGRYLEAREVLDELILPARRVGGSMILMPTLLLEAKLEDARGNRAAARQALAEAIEVSFSYSAVIYWFRPLLLAARLLPRDEAMGIAERVRVFADRDPSLDARLAEARAFLEEDPAGFRRAADLYASLGLSYQEARCRMESGDLESAARFVSKHPLAQGPLGTRLAELRRP